MSNKISSIHFIMKTLFLFALSLFAAVGGFSNKAFAQYKPEDIVRPPVLTESIIYENNDTTKLAIYERYFFDSQIEKGEMLNGLKTGDWYYFDPQGRNIARGHFKEGKKTGQWLYYDSAHVNRCEIYFKDGMADSIWKGYSNFGLPLFKAKYKYGGIIDTLVTRHENGTYAMKMIYRNGTPYFVIGQWDVYGNPLESGDFKYGTGTLMRYYPYGQLYSIEQYSGGTLSGECKYIGSDGVKKNYGMYVDGKKAETWMYLNYDGSEAQYAATGKLIAPFDHNMTFDPQNQYLFTPAKYPGGYKEMKKYLQSIFVYPEEARSLKISGTVWLNCEVDELGHMGDIKVFNSINEQCDAEAVFLVKNMPDWWPAFQQGIPVKSRVYIPVEFVLE